MYIQSHSAVHCQWNIFRHNYFVIPVLDMLPLAEGATSFHWSYPITIYYIFAVAKAETVVVC